MCRVFGSMPNIVLNSDNTILSVGVEEGLKTRNNPFLHYLLLLKGISELLHGRY